MENNDWTSLITAPFDDVMLKCTRWKKFKHVMLSTIWTDSLTLTRSWLHRSDWSQQVQVVSWTFLWIPNLPRRLCVGRYTSIWPTNTSLLASWKYFVANCIKKLSKLKLKTAQNGNILRIIGTRLSNLVLKDFFYVATWKLDNRMVWQ